MKKLAAGLLCTTLALSIAGCSGTSTKEQTSPASPKPVSQKTEKIKVVATIFPEYDWARQIIGEDNENIDLSYLLSNGVDLHSFQPSADDIVKISSSDIFIYVGGESDQWVTDTLKSAVNKDMVVINLMEILGSDAKEEELKEGMQGEDDEHDHDHNEDDPSAESSKSDDDTDHSEDSAAAESSEEEEEKEYDEHVWLSLRNAKLFCTKIADVLAEKDPSHASDYQTRLNDYTAQLDSLDQEFETMIGKSSQKTLIFADRFPFRYFTDDYHLDYYAAFVGCSAESEASFETIAFLSSKVDELDVHTIFTIEGSDGAIAQTVINNTKTKDQEVAILNSIQSVTKKDIDNGTSYLGIMKENYQVLDKALNGTEPAESSVNTSADAA